MLNREDWLMIREMREKGCYLREIAERVSCSERTVRRALQRGGPPPRRRPGVRPSKLDPYKAQVDQLLAEDVWNATVIFAEIKTLGYTGGISILRDYIRPKRALRKARGTVRFETALCARPPRTPIIQEFPDADMSGKFVKGCRAMGMLVF